MLGPVEAASAKDETRRRLEERPYLPLRLRITLVFVIYACFVIGITIGLMVMLARFETKMRFLEAADDTAFELQEARRYEKNFFLYGTSLSDASDHAVRADRLLESNLDAVAGVVGPAAARAWLEKLRSYEALLDRLAVEAARPGFGDPQRKAAEVDLRRIGGALLHDASTMIAQERASMNAMLRTAMVVGAAFLVLLVLLMVMLADQLTRQVLRPIGRFVRYFERIAAGDLAPIQPARRYRDEFSTLAVAINRMLDELKTRQEQLLQSGKLAAVGTLTSGIAHELNNPLNNISLTVETLLEDDRDLDGERRRELLADISTQVERAGATVRNLLDFTRKDEPVRTALSVGEVVATALNLVRNELALGGVKAAVEIPPDLPAIRGNPRNLQQLFLNLFLNAIQAMPRGGELRVIAGAEEGSVRVAVRDTGAGIPAENLARVFEPFFTTKGAGEGTGLGLSVCRSIAEKHGGRIEVGSRPGEGSTFTVFLPTAERGAA